MFTGQGVQDAEQRVNKRVPVVPRVQLTGTGVSQECNQWDVQMGHFRWHAESGG